VEGGRDGLARVYQVGEQALVDVQIAFILPAIAEVVAPGKHPPHLGAETERVREHLKHDVAVRGTIARVAKRGEAERVGGVVGEIESTLQRICLVLCIGKSLETGLLEPGKFFRVRRFLA